MVVMRVTLLVLLVLLAPGSRARADTEPVHYGHRVAAIDGITVGVFAGGAALVTQVDSDVRYLGVLPMVLGTIGYVYMPPAIHATLDQIWTARASFAMRVLLPPAGIAITSQLRSCPDDDGRSNTCQRTNMAIGAGAGILVASAIDALLLARADVPRPYVAPGGDGTGASFGLMGRF